MRELVTYFCNLLCSINELLISFCIRRHYWLNHINIYCLICVIDMDSVIYPTSLAFFFLVSLVCSMQMANEILPNQGLSLFTRHSISSAKTCCIKIILQLCVVIFSRRMFYTRYNLFAIQNLDCTVKFKPFGFHFDDTSHSYRKPR